MLVGTKKIPIAKESVFDTCPVARISLSKAFEFSAAR